MILLVTVNDSFVRTPDGKIWNNGIYSNVFFQRYLTSFEKVRIVCRVNDVQTIDLNHYNCLDDQNIEVFPIPFFHGPIEYAKNLLKIKKALRKSYIGCSAGVLRIPDELSFSLSKLLFKNKIPFAVENVSDSWDFFRPGTFKTILRPYLRFRWWHLQKKWCGKANCVSYVTKDYIQKRFPSHADNITRFETFYTSANLTSDYFLNARSQNDFLKNNTIHLLNVAGINSFSKGHKQLIDSIKILSDEGFLINATFVGGGSMLDYFKEYASVSGVEKNILFTGEIKERETILSYMKKADLFVFPTMTEGLPRAVLEAMAAGLPIISSPVGGIPELLTNEMMFDRIDGETIANKIKEVCSKDNLLRMSSYSCEKIQEYSSVEIEKRRTAFYGCLKRIAIKKGETQ